MLSIETVATLNAAFCDYSMVRCPPSQQLVDVCMEVRLGGATGGGGRGGCHVLSLHDSGALLSLPYVGLGW